VLGVFGVGGFFKPFESTRLKLRVKKIKPL